MPRNSSSDDKYAATIDPQKDGPRKALTTRSGALDARGRSAMVLDVTTLTTPMYMNAGVADLRIDAAALYTRVSTLDQARGYGRAAQVSNVGRFAERDDTIRLLTEEYNDDAVSGKKVSRAGIDKLLKDAANGKIDLVIV